MRTADDWKAEVRGLGYMILDIAAQWEATGDTELFRGRLFSARDYVDGPLRELLAQDGPVECKCTKGQMPLPNPRCEMHGSMS